MTSYRKKLIEVALPLEAINVASAREKSIRHGHPSTLHLWWARRPLAACRAVIFTSLVDDPDDPTAPPDFIAACKALPKGKNAADHDTPRQRLFDFIERLVTWEATTDEIILEKARELIRLCTDGNPPPLLDPFAGGGSIPLEAQRLGLEAHASDLNPVAVMINKALIEIPPKFANRPPVNPRDRGGTAGGGSWKGAAGLAADVRYYGEWVRDRAWERIGHLYPQLNGETVIAWLWARTVKCPNPACGAQMPLVRSFDLSKKRGYRAWVEPNVDAIAKVIEFDVKKATKGKSPDGTVSRQGTVCLVCETPVPFDYIREAGRAGKFRAQLMAIITEGQSGRDYYKPTNEHEAIASVTPPIDVLETNLPEKALGFRVQLYGMTKHKHLYSDRQLLALSTFGNLVVEARQQAEVDAIESGLLPSDEITLQAGGSGAKAYSESISVYLSFLVDQLASHQSTICTWNSPNTQMRNTFARHALPMTWDFAESNPFCESSGSYHNLFERLGKAFDAIPARGVGKTYLADAVNDMVDLEDVVVSTDPPYYDNIGYADLSDYFYTWMRRPLKDVFDDLFTTLLVPKSRELISSPFRFNGSANKAKRFFESGLSKFFLNSKRIANTDFPITVYYAFKQNEVILEEGTSNTGWETMLDSLIVAGLKVGGTWPMRTEKKGRSIEIGTNALASSIVLVCRPRPDDAPTTSRRDFVNALRRELPSALREMLSGSIAPVDLAQATIGPGMAVYSRYAQVLEPDGRRLTVRTALQLINHELDAFLTEQEGEMDTDSRFAVAWFEQFGLKEGPFGQADVLARAKNTSVAGLVDAGVLRSGAGKVRLLTWRELNPDWDPTTDKRPTVWEATHHLIGRLNGEGEAGAARLLARMPADLAAGARALAYRLYSLCERKSWAEQARDYNALVISWTASQEQAREMAEQVQQGRLF